MLLFLEDTTQAACAGRPEETPKILSKITDVNITQHQKLSITIYLQKISFILCSPIPIL